MVASLFFLFFFFFIVQYITSLLQFCVVWYKCIIHFPVYRHLSYYHLGGTFTNKAIVNILIHLLVDIS